VPDSRRTSVEGLKLLTVRECADLTGTSVAYWRKAISRRRIPVHRIGRLVRVAERDLEAHLRAGFQARREA
jgi:excisionase family DNA binding protein